MAGPVMLDKNLLDLINGILDLDTPFSLPESSSTYYVLSILETFLDTDTDNLNIQLLEALKGNFKLISKLEKNHRKELFLHIIKRCFERERLSKEKTDSLLQYFNNAKASLELTDTEIKQVYFSIHPNAFPLAQIRKHQDYVNELMAKLTVAACKAASSERIKEFELALDNNFVELMPIFKFYGYQEFKEPYHIYFWTTQELTLNWINQSDKDASWLQQTPQGLALRALKYYNDQQLIISQVGDETYIGPKGGLADAQRRKAFQQFMVSLGHLEGGLFEFLGYLLGGDKLADIGATIDALAQASKDAKEMKQYYQSISASASPKAAITNYMSREELAQLRNTRPSEMPAHMSGGEGKAAVPPPAMPSTGITGGRSGGVAGKPPGPPVARPTQPLPMPSTGVTARPQNPPIKAATPAATTETTIDVEPDITARSEQFLKQNAGNLHIIEIEYKGKLTDSAGDANFLRFGVEWAQSEGVALIIGSRSTEDGALRRIARRWMDRQGISRANRQAMHPMDSIINPFLIQQGSQGTGYYFGNKAVNLAFGGQLAKLGHLPPGTRVGIRFVGFPSYKVAPPIAPPASPPDLKRKK